MKKLRLALIAIFATTAAITDLTAGFWDWSLPYGGPSKDVITLLVTGNYTKQRILAELIQQETKQPILLLPAAPGGSR